MDRKSVGRVHDRERVQQRGRVARSPGRGRGRGVAAQQPDRLARPGQVYCDRGGRADRPFERGHGTPIGPGIGAGVEEQGRAARAEALFLAHHQGAGAGAGPPVNPPKVVAGLIRTGGEVVRTSSRHMPVTVGVDRDITAGTGPGQDLHRRGHDQLVAAAERARELAEPEGIRDPDRHRTDHVAAAQLGTKLVGEVPGATRLHPVEHEPGPEAERVWNLVIDQQDRGGTSTHVVDPDADRHGTAHGHPGGHEKAVAREPVAGLAHERRRAHRQRHQQNADAEQVLLADRGGQCAAGQSGGHEAEPADGQPAYRRQKVEHGNSTAAVRRTCPMAWDGDTRDDVRNDPGGDVGHGRARHRDVGVHQQPVCEHRRRHGLDVVG